MPPALAQEKYEKNATCTWWLQSIHEKKMKNITENKNVRKMPPALAREKNEKKTQEKKEKNATCTSWLLSCSSPSSSPTCTGQCHCILQRRKCMFKFWMEISKLLWNFKLPVNVIVSCKKRKYAFKS